MMESILDDKKENHRREHETIKMYLKVSENILRTSVFTFVQ